MNPPSLLSPLQRLLGDERRRQATDRDLLRAFVQQGEEAVFAELLRRHGPMVLHLSLHLLRHRQDAEDVFQATFLTLARKAHSLRNEACVAAWLHRVAWNLCLRSRAAQRRTAGDSRLVAAHQPADAGDPAEEISLREVRALLHQELAALPERLRLPLVLCYLQGRTRDEAARRLGWSLATLKRRLEQGRKLLHARLSRRGVTLSAVLSASLLTSTEVSASLAKCTLRLAASCVAGSMTALPASVAALLKASSSVKVKVLWGLMLMLSACAGTGAWVYQSRAEVPSISLSVGQSPPNHPLDADKRAKAEGPRRDPLSDSLPAGAVARLGRTQFRHSSHVEGLAFSPDGKSVASSGMDRTVRLWDVKTGRQVGVSSFQWGVSSALAYSPDGSTLAVCETRGNKPGIFLLNAATAKEQRFVAFPKPNVPIDPGGLGAVAFSPDGKHLASAKPDGQVCLLDPASGKITAVLGKHDHSNVPVLVFSPDGRILASSGQDVTIRLWDVAQRKALFVLRSEDTNAFPLVFSRDGKWLISGGGRQENPNDFSSAWRHSSIRVWDAATGKQLRVFKDGNASGSICSLALAPDDRTLAFSRGNTLRLMDVTTGKVLRSLTKPTNRYFPVSSLRFSPDGKTLAGGIGNMVGLWDVASGRLLNLDAGESTDIITSVALSGDGRLLAIADMDGYLSLWDFRSRRLIRRFRGHDTSARRIAFSPDSKTLASISEYGHVRAWDVVSGRQRYQFPVDTPKDTCPMELAFSPDGKLLAYAYFTAAQNGGPRGIRLLDAATGAERQNLTIADAVLRWFVGIGFSPDGEHLVGTTAEGEIYGWRREANHFVEQGLIGKEPQASTVAYTDRGFLSIYSFSGKVRPIRDFETGRPIRAFPEFPRLGYQLALSPDGHYLAAGPSIVLEHDSAQPRDQTLRVCEMATGQEVLRWSLPPDTDCTTLQFAPDGRTLVAGMADTTVLIWNLIPAAKGTAKDISALWADLATNDAAKAYRARCRLLAAPADALALLCRHLKPVEGVEEKRIQRLIAELDSEAFAVREKATEQLRKLGALAEPACRKVLAAKPTLEMKRRLQDLLEDITAWRPSPELLRQLRALEVLERIGTPEAQALLQSLADGAAGARLTVEARAAVQRLQARRGDKP